MTTADESATPPMKAMSPDALTSLFQAVAGLRNFRAAAAMLTCFALSVVVPGLLWTLLGKGAAAGGLGALVAIFLIASGIHAGGLLLMDQARQVPMRSVTEAIVLGMWCVPKSIVLAIGAAIAVVAVYLLIALLIYVCKLPGLGPLLYVIVLPVAVVVAGMAFVALFLGMTLALAAMWEGASITAAFVKALAILRTRLVETMLMLVRCALSRRPRVLVCGRRAHARLPASGGHVGFHLGGFARSVWRFGELHDGQQ